MGLQWLCSISIVRFKYADSLGGFFFFCTGVRVYAKWLEARVKHMAGTCRFHALRLSFIPELETLEKGVLLAGRYLG